MRASSYLNEIGLEEWRKILAEELPGATITYERDEGLRGELQSIRAAGELSEYLDEELLIHTIIAVWKKPG